MADVVLSAGANTISLQRVVTASAGSVTSVALALPSIFTVSGSPVTVSGTLTGALSAQAANAVFAGPVSGPAAAPTFRALTSNDIPPSGSVTSVALSLPATFAVAGSPVTAAGTLSATYVAQSPNTLLAGPGSGATPATPAFRTLTLADLPSGIATGTVTSVALALPSVFTVAGSPVTSAGTLSATLATQSAATVFAGPTSGAAAAPAFRALAQTDLPATTGTVTSVALGLPGIFTVAGSPVTTAGTLSASLATQAPNAVWAGPSSGGAAATPTFRGLVAADLPPGTGTVTSVALSLPALFTVAGSPVTSSGSLSASLVTQSANTVWAGPTNGAAVAPAFRSLVAADLPAGTGTVTSVALTLPSLFSVAGSPVTASGTLSASLVSQTANQVLASPSGSAGAPTFRALVAADLPNSTGTVTSVALALPSIFTVSGSPVTASGTLTGSLASQAANLVLASPNGASGTPTFRSLVAADLPGTTGSGTVTSVALALPSIFAVSGSPVTTSGTLTGALTTQSPNTVFAGPGSGASAATPTFRALVAADIPAGAGGSVTSVALALPSIFTVSGSPVTSTGTLTGSLATQAANTFFGGPASAPAAAPTFRALAAADMPSGTGTVTSVALALPAELSVSGSPVTTAGTLTGAWASQTAAKVFAAPTGAAGTPSFRALASSDLPAGTGTVTSVALTLPSILSVGGSPITAAGTLSATLATQTPNSVWAGPGSGATAAAPTFRSLVAADLPAGTGTVTSVALTLPSIFAVAGSPVTSSGTLAGTLSTQSANTVFAGPASGVAAAPTFRSLAAADVTPSGAYVPGTSGDLNLQGSLLKDTVGPLTSPAGQIWAWSGRSQVSSGADGNVLLTNAAATAFGLLQGGGTTAGFPAWKRSAATWAARLADDSGDASLSVGGLTISGAANILADAANVGFSKLLVFGTSGTAYQALKASPTGLQVRYADDSATGDLIARTFYATLTGDAVIAISGNLVAGASRAIKFNTSSQLIDTTNGTLSLAKADGSALSLLTFGTTSTYPALKNVGNTALSARNMGDTADVNFTAANHIASASSAAAPGFAFGTGLGLYSTGATNLSLAVGSANVWGIDGSGNQSLLAGASQTWAARAVITSPADGYLQIQNNAGSGTGQTLVLGANGSAANGMRIYRANATVLGIVDGGGSFSIAGQASAWKAAGGSSSATAPAYGSFNATQGSGLYFPSVTTCGLAANGAAALTFDASSNATFAAKAAFQKPNATKSASYTVLAADTNTTFEVSALATMTLPTIGTTNIGFQVTFVATAAVVVTITPNAADSIIQAGTTLAAGASLTSNGVKGATVTLHATSANTWSVRATTGFGSTYDGTVTSVALALPSLFSVTGSPVTASGTLTGSLATQTANTVFAGPTSGGAAAPTFRALVSADVPAGGGGSAGVTYDETQLYLDDHFLNFQNGSTVSVNGNIPPYWGVYGSGTGQGVRVGQVAGVAGHPGIYSIDPGTTSTGYTVMFAYYNSLVCGAGPVRIDWIVQVPVLSTSTDRFTFFCGLANGLSSGLSFTSGVTWQYSDTINGGKWALGGAQATVVDSGVTVVAGTWYRLSLRLDSTSANCAGYINGSSVATTTSNLPTSTAGATGLQCQMIKSVGTTARVVYLDRVMMTMSSINPA